jgi:hypothetical protein
MTRKQIILFIFMDIVMMFFSGHGAWSRYHILLGEMSESSSEADLPVEGTAAVVSGGSAEPVELGQVTAPDPAGEGNPVVAQPAVPAPAATETTAQPPAPPPAPLPAPPAPSPTTKSVTTRKTFSYDNSNAKEVLLVGDFNKWTPQSFSRDAKGRWSTSISLLPGDFSYSFIVDGKTIRDPYQRRTDAKGRSLLTVK